MPTLARVHAIVEVRAPFPLPHSFARTHAHVLSLPLSPSLTQKYSRTQILKTYHVYSLAVVVESQLRIVSIDYSQSVDIATMALPPFAHAAHSPLPLAAGVSHDGDAFPPASKQPSVWAEAARLYEENMRRDAVGVRSRADDIAEIGAGLGGPRNDFVASHVLWLASSDCVLLACNSLVRGTNLPHGTELDEGVDKSASCELRLIVLGGPDQAVGDQVEALLLGRQEYVYCMSLVTTR